MILLILRWVCAIGIAFLLGKLVSRLKLPSLLGWLLGGMILGPYALNLMNQDLIGSHSYETILKILECAVGFMIGTELIFKKLKAYGKPLIITTIFQSVGTYIVVALIFGPVFALMNIPVYLAFILGGIALATAPAPALSIVQEFKASGPVTNTLIPMAALDDMVGGYLLLFYHFLYYHEAFRRKCTIVFGTGYDFFAPCHRLHNRISGGFFIKKI